jgi:hypothetical protein
VRRLGSIALLLAISLLALTPKILVAQTEQDPSDLTPSDNDLFSGYCLGVFAEQESELKSLSDSEKPTSTPQMLSTIKRNEARVLSYLVSKNMLDNYGISIAWRTDRLTKKIP